MITISEGAAFLVISILIGALLWIGYQIRVLHGDLQPLIDSPLVQSLAAAGT